MPILDDISYMEMAALEKRQTAKPVELDTLLNVLTGIWEALNDCSAKASSMNLFLANEKAYDVLPTADPTSLWAIALNARDKAIQLREQLGDLQARIG